MATSSNPITQVSATTAPPSHGLHQELLTKFDLDLRGTRFQVDRDTIMNLPEAIIICLFPNGLAMSRNLGGGTDGGESEDEEYVYAVDFDPACFTYILNFFRVSQEVFYGTADAPGLFHAQQPLFDQNTHPLPEYVHNPLLKKQPIILLREELEYFTIPSKGYKAGTDEHGNADAALLDLKKECGQILLEKNSIFGPLERNPNRENHLAEQHLIMMLVSSGFKRDDVWGHRSIDPNRCCISSIALCLLNAGIVHTPSADGGVVVTVDNQQMATSQKLLLFWRKPARKCWWDGVEVDLTPSGGEPKGVKLWARRVWTLELCLI